MCKKRKINLPQETEIKIRIIQNVFFTLDTSITGICNRSRLTNSDVFIRHKQSIFNQTRLNEKIIFFYNYVKSTCLCQTKQSPGSWYHLSRLRSLAVVRWLRNVHVSSGRQSLKTNVWNLYLGKQNGSKNLFNESTTSFVVFQIWFNETFKIKKWGPHITSNLIQLNECEKATSTFWM